MPEQIVKVLQQIVTGRRCFSKITEDLVVKELVKKVVADHLPHNDLSDRELHVFMMLGQGKTLTQISKDLSLSVKTVSTYRQRTLKKMQMTSNAQIMKYLFTHSLIPIIENTFIP